MAHFYARTRTVAQQTVRSAKIGMESCAAEVRQKGLNACAAGAVLLGKYVPGLDCVEKRGRSGAGAV